MGRICRNNHKLWCFNKSAVRIPSEISDAQELHYSFLLSREFAPSSAVRLCAPSVRERPPGLILHVLTVPVFWLRVLLMAGTPSFAQKPQSLCVPGLAFASCALRAHSRVCCPQLPCHTCENGTHSTSFLQHKGARTESAVLGRDPWVFAFA